MVYSSQYQDQSADQRLPPLLVERCPPFHKEEDHQVRDNL